MSHTPRGLNALCPYVVDGHGGYDDNDDNDDDDEVPIPLDFCFREDESWDGHSDRSQDHHHNQVLRTQRHREERYRRLSPTTFEVTVKVLETKVWSGDVVTRSVVSVSTRKHRV